MERPCSISRLNIQGLTPLGRNDVDRKALSPSVSWARINLPVVSCLPYETSAVSSLYLRAALAPVAAASIPPPPLFAPNVVS